MTKIEALDDLVLAHAQSRPDATALIFHSRTVSYAELQSAVNRLALLLSGRGIGRGDFVVALLPPSVEIIITLLAISRVGAIYAPLDPEHPDSQLAEKFDQLTPAVVLAFRTEMGRAALLGKSAMWLDDIDLYSGPPQQLQCERNISPDDPACIFFTSGSTGKPKGVIGSYRSVRDSIIEPSQHLGIGPTDTLNSIARYTWSISMLELLGALVAGGTLLILDRTQALDLDWLKQQAEQCSCFHCPPALLKTLTDHVDRFYPDSRSFDAVRLVWYGGDTFHPNEIARLQRIFPNARIATAYGCTEIFGLSHCHFYTGDTPVERVLIGRPVGAMRQRILNEAGNDCAVGESGEIHLGGSRIASEYWQQPALTADHFVLLDGERYYATGDYAVLHDNGELEYLQRQDSQVKISGIRIELGEIEHHIRNIRGVREVMVLAPENRDHSRQLHAFITTTGNPSISRDAVFEQLASTLPAYAIPSRIDLLEKFPYTENFKIDRKALLAMAEQAPTAEAAFANPFQQAIAELWHEAAQARPERTDDNFFMIGGNSITAARLASLLNKKLNVSAEVADIYRFPRLGELATELQGRSGHALTPQADDQALFGGLNQVGLLFRELFEMKGESITCTRYIRSLRGYDLGRLQAALVQVVERHKTLRTQIRLAKGKLQLTLQDANEVPVLQLPGLWTVDDSDAAGSRTYHKQPVKFALGSTPLLHASIARLSEGGELLQLTAQHIAVDDNSMGRIAEDFVAIYDALMRGTTAVLKPLAEEYADYLADHALKLADGHFEQAAAAVGARLTAALRKHPDPLLVTETLSGAAAPLTHDRPVPLPPHGEAATFVEYIAALSWAMRDIWGRDSFVFCAHVALRRDSPEEPRVGMYINLVPIFTGVDSSHSYNEHCQRTLHDFEEAMARSDVPYELVLGSDDALRRRRGYPFDAFVNELRFEENYPDGYTDVFVRRAFATDSHEISLSVIRTNGDDEIRLESPAFSDGSAKLARLAENMRLLLAGTPERAI